jgi:hypothetical protein
MLVRNNCIFILIGMFMMHSSWSDDVVRLYWKKSQDIIPVIQPMLQGTESIRGWGDRVIIKANSQRTVDIRDAVERLDRKPSTVPLMKEIEPDRDDSKATLFEPTLLKVDVLQDIPPEGKNLSIFNVEFSGGGSHQKQHFIREDDSFRLEAPYTVGARRKIHFFASKDGAPWWAISLGSGFLQKHIRLNEFDVYPYFVNKNHLNLSITAHKNSHQLYKRLTFQPLDAWIDIGQIVLDRTSRRYLIFMGSESSLPMQLDPIGRIKIRFRLDDDL